MSEYLKEAFKAGTAGLVLAISLAYGVDISKEAISLIVIQGIFDGLVGFGWKIVSLIVNFTFFIFGIILSYKEVEDILDEGWEIIAVNTLFFTSMFLIYLGMAIGSDIQSLGAYFLVGGILLLVYLKKYE